LRFRGQVVAARSDTANLDDVGERQTPIAFAHRGARAHAPENTIEAFQLALRLGATGLESDVWLTADGDPVLDHDGIVKVGMRPRPISEVKRRKLPSHIPGLDDVYAACGTSFEFSLDVKDPNAYDSVVAVARASGGDAVSKLWLCDRWPRIADQRARFPDVHLVDSNRLRWITDGPERHGAALSAAGIDCINMHYTDWTLGLTTLFHRFDLLTFGWDAQHDRMLLDLISYGIDGLYCDDVDRMMTIVRKFEAQ
jgi:glycerophosphoryl diester phosphodiesterase